MIDVNEGLIELMSRVIGWLRDRSVSRSQESEEDFYSLALDDSIRDDDHD